MFYFALKTKEKFDAVDLYFSAKRRKNEEEEEENKNKQICAQCFGYLLRVDLDLQLFPNSFFKKENCDAGGSVIEAALLTSWLRRAWFSVSVTFFRQSITVVKLTVQCNSFLDSSVLTGFILRFERRVIKYFRILPQKKKIPVQFDFFLVFRGLICFLSIER